MSGGRFRRSPAQPSARSAAALAAGVLACAAACGPTDFAAVTLAVREPAGQTRRVDSPLTNLSYQLDDERPESVSFKQGDPQSFALPLGAQERVLAVSFSTGDPENPSALGRAAPVTIPSVNDPAVVQDGAPSFSASLPMLLAKPDAAELVDKDIPSERTGTAVCDELSGRGWVVGGTSPGGTPVNAYTFDEKSLIATTAFGAGFTGTVACDGDEDGHVLVWEPTLNALHVDAAGDDLRVSVFATAPSEADGAYVGVVGDVAWVANGDAAALVDVADGHPLLRRSLGSQVTSRFMALDATTLLRFFTGQTEAVRKSGDTLVTLSGPGVDLLAVDSDRPRALLTGGSLVLPVVSSDSIDFQLLRTIDLQGTTPDQMLTLDDHRIVLLDTTHGLLLVEGGAPVAVNNREHMMRTVGGAIVLFGGDKGHDVVVPPL